MNIRDRLGRLNRLQQATPFKVVTSLIVFGLAVAIFVIAFVAATAPGADTATAATLQALRDTGQLGPDEEILIESTLGRDGLMALAVGLGFVSAIAMTVIWLGLGLTYIALLLVAFFMAWPLALLGFPGSARMLAGMVVLTAAFVALLQGLRLLFSGPGPVMGIARNVLIEAVRMKVALVFIVLLILALAALPGMLDQSTPLRYRVQSFLQYGTGASYWIIAILVLFFSVGSVAFEQRDRQIWQTMTKPVAAWQYILGKWLGVMGLSAALLAVCCAGVFLFTEYLRSQPAMGEKVRMIVADTSISEDRRILEDQILAARRIVEPGLPLGPNDPEFLEMVRRYILNRQEHEPEFAKDPGTFDHVRSDLYRDYSQTYRSVGPGRDQDFLFEGLHRARERNLPLLLRYRIDAAGNPPGEIYHLTFIFNNAVMLPPQGISLGPSHTLAIDREIIEQVVNEDGTVLMRVFNGRLMPDAAGNLGQIPNPTTFTFPPGGLQLSYSAGSYQMNFVRVAFILWLKIAFLAILGITTATFLSFPVACLVAFSVFLAAEGAGFLADSIQYYDALDHDGNVVYWKIPVRAIGLGLAAAFQTYAELRPTSRLVDGILLSWTSVAWGMGVLLVWTGVLFGVAVAVFRRRELATYSGQ